MHRIKETLMNELMEFGEKMAKNPNAKPSVQEIERVHKLTDTIKNLDKIEMLEEESGGYSEEGGSYARGGRGRGRNARRDSMGRYSREGGYSEEGGSYGGGSYGGGSYAGGRGSSRGGLSYAGYSRDGSDMMERLEEMMHEASDPKEREAIKRCMRELEN